jgi:hypothetical protein
MRCSIPAAITITGAGVTTHNLTLNSGVVTFDGGPLTFAGGTPTVNVVSGATLALADGMSLIGPAITNLEAGATLALGTGAAYGCNTGDDTINADGAIAAPAASINAQATTR